VLTSWFIGFPEVCRGGAGVRRDCGSPFQHFREAGESEETPIPDRRIHRVLAGRAMAMLIVGVPRDLSGR